MRILITGVDGQLGSQLVKNPQTNLEVIGLNKNQFNLLNFEQCRKTILNLKPDWIINTAAFTAVDKAEIELKKTILHFCYLFYKFFLF